MVGVKPKSFMIMVLGVAEEKKRTGTENGGTSPAGGREVSGGFFYQRRGCSRRNLAEKSGKPNG